METPVQVSPGCAGPRTGRIAKDGKRWTNVAPAGRLRPPERFFDDGEMMKLSELFLNEGTPAVVEAPAFSLTKVMAVIAPVVTAVVAYVTTFLSDAEFSTGQVTVLIVALLGFLAITGAADVLARAVATSAEKSLGTRAPLVPFNVPLTATLDLAGRDEDVNVVAARDGQPPQFLCTRADGSLTWKPAAEVKFKA